MAEASPLYARSRSPSPNRDIHHNSITSHLHHLHHLHHNHSLPTRKMFATLPPISQHTFQPSYYAPTVSSPLSSSPLRTSPLAPRDGNINANFQMSSPTPPNKRARDENAYSRRIVKKNPLVHRDSDDGRETRRKLFLRRVREDSEEKRWEKRGGDDEVYSNLLIWRCMDEPGLT